MTRFLLIALVLAVSVSAMAQVHPPDPFPEPYRRIPRHLILDGPYNIYAANVSVDGVTVSADTLTAMSVVYDATQVVAGTGTLTWYLENQTMKVAHALVHLGGRRFVWGEQVASSPDEQGVIGIRGATFGVDCGLQVRFATALAVTTPAEVYVWFEEVAEVPDVEWYALPFHQGLESPTYWSHLTLNFGM